LTHYGVPDDEMPDSILPPWWGPAPFDEPDLDAVLSGETIDIPVALRPVADALAALQAAPMPAELRGQATIMAEFRALAEFRAAGLGQDRRATDPAQTLVLSGPQERLGHRRAPRHRARRRAAPASNWRPGTLIGAAATVVVLAAVVLAGYVPGPFHRGGTPSASTSSAAKYAGGNSSSPKGEGSASPEPTPRPTIGGSATSQQAKASSLCNALYDLVKHPRLSANSKQELDLWNQLSMLADSSHPSRVAVYCAPYVPDLFPHGIPANLSHGPGSGDQGPGSSQVGQDNQSGALAHP
jgi:hypothetical protein